MTLRRHVCFVLVVLAGSLSALAAVVRLDAPQQQAVVFGATLAALNAVLSHGLLLWSEGRSTKAFLVVVLGGMAGRMGLVIAGVLVALLTMDLPQLPLLASLLGYFVVFHVMELAGLRRHERRIAPEAR